MSKSNKPTSSNKLVFFGNERLASGLPLIKPLVLPALIKAGYDIEAVVVNQHDIQSRKARTLEIAQVAEQHKIPVIGLDELAETEAQAAVLVAFGRIVPTEIIEQFPLGIINIHPSLLPKYRGPTPLEQTILDGATQSGVSLMKLVPEMDAGPVYAQAKVQLNGQETKPEMAYTMLAAGRDLLLKNLPRILDSTLSASQQDDSQATYTKLLTKADGQLDLQGSAELLERQVRSYGGFPKSRLSLFENDIVVTKARVAESEADGALDVKCQPGWLEIQELIAPSGKTMTGAEFLRGYKKL